MNEDDDDNKALQVLENITSQGRQHYDESHNDTCSSIDEDSNGDREVDEESVRE